MAWSDFDERTDVEFPNPLSVGEVEALLFELTKKFDYDFIYTVREKKVVGNRVNFQDLSGATRSRRTSLSGVVHAGMTYLQQGGNMEEFEAVPNRECDGFLGIKFNTAPFDYEELRVGAKRMISDTLGGIKDIFRDYLKITK